MFLAEVPLWKFDRMIDGILLNVRKLRISEIAELWSKESDQTRLMLERSIIEWLEYYLDASNDEFNSGEIENLEATSESVGLGDFDSDTEIPRHMLELYCKKNGIPEPVFWFGKPDQSAAKIKRKPGKPSYAKEYIDLFHQLVEEKVITKDQSKKQMANILHERNGSVKPRTIEGYIAAVVAEFKSQPEKP